MTVHPPPQPRPNRGTAKMSVRPGAYELHKHGASRWDLKDPYHLAVGLSWRGFLLLFVVLQLIINVIFAALYLLQPGSIANAKPDSFLDAFFFSMETLATVGYGAMSPGTLYAHVISAIEITCGMAFVAIMTGLTFVRFARPRGKILFADKGVIAVHNGHPTLMIRIANGRVTNLTDATARLSALLRETTSEGLMFRGIHELPLLRSRIPYFPLTWTLMHRIDQHSPLRGMLDGAPMLNDARLFVSIEARDPTLAAQIYAIRDYGSPDIAHGMRYADAVTVDERGRTHADLGRISDLTADPFAGKGLPALQEA